MIKKLFQLFQTAPLVESTASINDMDNTVSDEQPEQELQVIDTPQIEEIAVVAVPEPAISNWAFLFSHR